ncbi:hypothetical protein B0H16DRAFT_174414 [Mycena metata]|uniref:NodB homology domain-containing protein n=1 Tax=Mycena metata TaxID=1033252 RepID=A0AAD7I2W8_9AGAR|nr:hypothetical protein B0H16DRAFT_174414 [Mycena metata]
MSIPLILTSLLTTSAVLAFPNVRRAPQVYDACINANDIALTFDDGPYIYLRSISDQFTAAGAKATFYMNGNNWDCIYNADRISDVKYAYAAGHMIGSHTWSHADLTTLSTAQIQDGMFRMEEAFSRILGIKPAFMRPPFGSYNDNIQSIAAARGQSLALWDWDTGDADGNTTAQSEALYNDVISAKVKNALILEHETEETTANTLVPFAIKLFQGKGYNVIPTFGRYYFSLTIPLARDDGPMPRCQPLPGHRSCTATNRVLDVRWNTRSWRSLRRLHRMRNRHTRLLEYDHFRPD